MAARRDGVQLFIVDTISRPSRRKSRRSAACSAGRTALAAAEPDPLLTTYIKVPQDKELVFDLSAECGLYTRTLARSKRNNFV